MIKSPLELLTHTSAVLQFDWPTMKNKPFTSSKYYNGWFKQVLQDAGMKLFAPSDVAGYPAYYQIPNFYREWFNSSTILSRYSLPEMVLTNQKVIRGGKIAGLQAFDVIPWFMNNVTTNRDDAFNVVNSFLQFNLGYVPDGDRYDYYLNDIFLDNLHPNSWKFDNWLPFEASGYTEDSFVRTPLENLLRAILYSQEYQLM